MWPTYVRLEAGGREVYTVLDTFVAQKRNERWRGSMDIYLLF